MYTKKDRGKADGDFSYDNKGSCARLINYLSGNDEKLSDENLFFTAEREGLTKEQAQGLIDNNVMGLRAQDVKFYSFTLNPSQEELSHIGNSKIKLVDYVRSCMKEYALNFSAGDVKPNDVVWTGIIHDIRYYTNLDKQKYERQNPVGSFPFRTLEEVEKWQKANPGLNCPFQTEAIKKGNNMHVHVVVSRRDKEMKRTLTIEGRGAAKKFPLVAWQQKNQKIFQEKFRYSVGEDLYLENQKKRVLVELHKLKESRGIVLDERKVLQLVEQASNRGEILVNIRKLRRALNQGTLIKDYYHFVATGKDLPKQVPAPQIQPEPKNTIADNILSLLGEHSRYADEMDAYKINSKRRKKRRNLPR